MSLLLSRPRRRLGFPALRAEDLASILGILVAVLFLFRGAVFGGRTLFRRDINMVWLPQVEAFVRSIAAGSWPLWDPYRGFGQPLLADPRAEILYPPTWLNLVMPPWLYYTFFVVLHLVFSGGGLYLLGRRWGLSAAGAFVAAMAWTTSGPLLSLASMWHHLAGAAWIPWLFLATEATLDGPAVLGTLALGGAIVAQVLAGSPDFTILTAVPLVAYAAVRILRRGTSQPGRWTMAALLGLAGVFGVAVSAGQWLPTLEAARRSERWDLSSDAATTWSLHPASLMEVVLPFHWNDLPLLPQHSQAWLEGKEPWLHSIYLGIPAVCLAAAGLASPLARRKVFLLCLAGGAALFSLGRHTVAYRLVVDALPPLGMLRFPVKAMVLAAFACALLTGTGLDAWRSREVSPRARAWGAVAPALLLSALAAVAWLLATRGAERWGPEVLFRDPRWPSYREILAPTAAGLARSVGLGVAMLALAVGWTRLRPSWLAACLVTLVSADLLVAHWSLHPTAPRELFAIRPQVLPLLDTAAFQRLYVYDYSVLTAAQRARDPEAASVYRLKRLPPGWSPDAALALGVHMYLNPPTAGRWGLYGSYDLDILGFYPKPLAQLVERLRAVEGTPAHLRLLQMGAVANVLALRPEAWWNGLVEVDAVPSFFEEPIHVFKVPDPLPRAYLVEDARVADGEAALEAITDRAFDPRRTVLLSGGTPVPSSRSPFGGEGRIVEMRPDRVRVEASLPAPGFLVLVDAYDPGWRVSVDGREAELLRANLAFRAVRIPAGTHLVEFLYRPRAVIAGLAISAASLLLAGLAWRVAAGRPAKR